MGLFSKSGVKILNACSVLFALALPGASFGATVIADFEAGFPSGDFVNSSYLAGDSFARTLTPVTNPSNAGSAKGVEVGYDFAATNSWGATGVGFAGGTDWSAFDTISFWFLGSGGGSEFSLRVKDGSHFSHVWSAGFTDTSSDWRLISFDLDGASSDGFSGSGTFDLDTVFSSYIYWKGVGTGSFVVDDLFLTSSLPSVPVPASLPLALVGFGMMFALRRKSRSL